MSEISENVVGKLIQEKSRLHKDRVFLTFKGAVSAPMWLRVSVTCIGSI